MASNTTRVIALGALTGLGLVAALGAGNSGSVTPGPQSFTVASPLTKTGTLVGLGDPGQNKGWVGHDGGWSAVNVVTRVTPSYPLENAGSLAAPIIAFNESDCTGDGFGWVYDQGTWTCLPIVVGGVAACPGNEPLVGDDAGYRCGGQVTTGNLTAGHIYTDAGIAANAIRTNALTVGLGSSVSLIRSGSFTLSTGYSIAPNDVGSIVGFSMPGAVPGDFCAVSVGEGSQFPAGLILYCKVVYSDSVSVYGFCRSGSECVGVPDAGFFGTIKAIVIH